MRTVDAGYFVSFDGGGLGVALVASAIGAAAVQPVIHAIAAEGAFERADHRISRRRRQILVATFTIRSQLKHLGLTLTSGYSNLKSVQAYQRFPGNGLRSSSGTSDLT